MLTSSAYLLPSVPTMLIDEQRGDITEMIEALQAAGRRTAVDAPEAIVVVSPRWVSTAAFLADDSRRHRSVVDLPEFGVEPRHDCPGAQSLARAIVEQAMKLGVRAATTRHGMDSGAGIPLHFIDRGRTLPVVPLSISDGTREEHRAWGEAIRIALNAWPGRVTFAVAGALSWNLHAFNLRREIPECDALDERVLAAMRDAQWPEIEAAVQRLGPKALPEADLRHLDVLRGFLLVGTAAGHVLEREQLPGIGTALVEFPIANDAGGAGR
jgi:aromatic ring-opening dioxygenase catalytic subunit (LigB family)